MTNLSPDWEALASSIKRREEILVTVKAYPNPSTKYIETVCVAGITRSGQWIRLYPIPYRSLAYDQRFPTYSWIEAEIRKSKDHRPESHYIDVSTLVVKGKLDTKNHWQARRELLLPLVSQSVEHLQERQQVEHISLGLIRPRKIKQLLIKPESPQWSQEELAKLRQRSLFDTLRNDGTYEATQELEKIPYRFLYEFVCDDPRCTGHKMSIISWEVMQSYRKWRQKYRDAWEERFRHRYENELPGPKCELYLFLGTIAKHPQEWTIIGLFYPPAQREYKVKAMPEDRLIQPKLFDEP